MTSDEHQCTVWPCNALGTRPSTLHSKGRQRNLGFRPIPTPASTLAPHPRLGFNTKARFETASQRRWSYAMLCSASTCNQHPRTIPHLGLAGHRQHNRLVERQTCSTGMSPSGTSAPILPSLFNVSFDNGTFVCWNTMSRAMYHHSRLCSSNMHVDILCNHKSAIESWSTTTTPTCCCQNWHTFKSAALNPDSDHWVLSGTSTRSCHTC